MANRKSKYIYNISNKLIVGVRIGYDSGTEGANENFFAIVYLFYFPYEIFEKCLFISFIDNRGSVIFLSWKKKIERNLIKSKNIDSTIHT